jgi:hypothetical protein
MADSNEKNAHRRANLLSIALALAALLATGTFYRVRVAEINRLVKRQISLPLLLSEIPKQIGSWTGTDVPISEAVQEVAGNDDFLSRVYLDRRTNQSANIYVGYSARPHTMVGHKPSVCYPANGWVYDEHRFSEFVSRGSRRISCMIHKFHRVMPEVGEVFVLNYYVVNGRTTTDERAFEGLGWRTPNIDGNPARYVAQIQISSSLERSIVNLAEDITDVLLDFLPDTNGVVKVKDAGVSK